MKSATMYIHALVSFCNNGRHVEQNSDAEVNSLTYYDFFFQEGVSSRSKGK